MPYHQGKCARLHGHSYRLDVAVRADLQKEGPQCGMVQDFDVLAAVVTRTVIDRLDHNSLNELIENPTCEVIVEWIWRQLKPDLPILDELILWETATSCAVLRASDFH